MSQSQIEKDYFDAIDRLKVTQERWMASLRPGDLFHGNYSRILTVESVGPKGIVPTDAGSYDSLAAPLADLAPRPLTPAERDRYERVQRLSALHDRLWKSDNPPSAEALAQIEAALAVPAKG